MIALTAHDYKDLIETASLLGGIIWGFIKFTAKLQVLERIPERLDELGQQINTVDRKVENLAGQFEIVKSYGRKY